VKVNKSVNVNKTVTNNTVVNRFSTGVRHRRHFGRGTVLISRQTYVVGQFRARHSRYSRRHARRSNTVNIVKGIVDNTNGNAGNGTIQVKTVSNSNRFQYGVEATAPKNAPSKTFNVNNGTRYVMVTAANGATRNSAFKDVAPGQAVVMLLPRNGNQLASTVEIFPPKK
jgi:hypothetical protein